MRWTRYLAVALVALGPPALYWGAVPSPAPARAGGPGGVQLSPELPFDVEHANPAQPTQREFDEYSWQSFVALNWPANADGTPNKDAVIGQDPKAKRVWEHYMIPDDVFLPDGSKPTWGPPKDRAAGLQMAKAGAEVKGAFLDALHFPVVDQEKNFVLFGIRLNKDEFDYIVANEFYSKKGQTADPPGGEKYVLFPAGEKGKQVGALEIKTAWRVLPAAADPKVVARYYTTEVEVAIPKENSATGEPLKLPLKLGLVAFHIAHKTKSRPQWVWSTFEHVDNLAAPAGIRPTFRDPACDAKACPPNNRPLPPGVPVPAKPDDPAAPPAARYLWSPAAPFAAPNQRIPTQVERLTPIQADVDSPGLNAAWQKKLRDVAPDSVWQHYQLISTQWPTKPFTRQPGQKPGTEGNPSIAQFEGAPAPKILANIPIEVYNQKTSSCIVCHSKAFTTRGDYADFSYLLQLAK